MRIIAGSARGRRIEAPAGKNTRPTLDRVRENLFNMLQTRISDSQILDLFSGSGALSLEAISRGAKSAVLVDADPQAHRVETRNAETLGFTDSCEIFLSDWKKAAKKLREQGRCFDIVFLDPPYEMTDLREVFGEIRALLSPGALVVVEHEADKEVLVGDDFEKIRERRWGFCAAAFYQERTGEEQNHESMRFSGEL